MLRGRTSPVSPEGWLQGRFLPRPLSLGPTRIHDILLCGRVDVSGVLTRSRRVLSLNADLFICRRSGWFLSCNDTMLICKTYVLVCVIPHDLKKHRRVILS